MKGFYDYRLVALSILIAICAAYSALELAARTTAATGKVRLAWVFGGALAMGFGIWSMHYVGMLAFSLPVPGQYDWPTVLLSLIAAIFASAVALFVVSRKKITWPRAVLGSVIMGGGISIMHYTGMAAMRLPAMCSYDPFLFGLSIILAIAISLIALWLTFQFRGDVRRSPWLKTGSALIMGSAIPTMHYTGMAAARFVPTYVQPDISHAVSTSTLGFAGVSIVTVLISGVAVLTSAFDRRFSTQRTQLLETERRYQLLVDGVKDCAIFMVDPHGNIASWNVGAERTYGYRAEEIIGRNFSCLYTPEDQESKKPGDWLDRAAREAKVEEQGWRVRKDGSRFWAEAVITSVWDKGILQGYSKVVRDITRRKQAEEGLRELSARLLQMRDEERRRIARELHDSAGQIIAAITMSLTPLTQNGLGEAEVVKVINECLGLLHQLSGEIRTLSHLLHPPLLDEVGLASALRLYVEGFSQRSTIHVELEIPPDFGRLSRDLETNIFRMVQECLTNIHRHSASPSAKIQIWRERIDSHEQVCVRVEDWGKGLIPPGDEEIDETRIGVGIRGMQERVHQLGGSIEIRSGAAARGTVISICLPLEDAAFAAL